MTNRSAVILLFFANSISGFAQGISMIAIPWYFSDMLKQPSTLGTAYGVITFITIFWSLYSGTLIDKYSRKHIFMVVNLCGGLVLTAAAITGHVLDYVPVGMALVVFASTFFVFNIHYPNLYAFIQEITEKHNYGKLNSYIEIQGQVTTASAGAAAAILLAGAPSGVFELGSLQLTLPFAFEAVALHQIFMLNAITYFIAFTFIIFIKYRAVLSRQASSGKVFERIKDGVRFLFQRKLILAFGILSHNIFVIVLVKLFYLFALYVSTHLNEKASVYASADMLFALGALFAGITTRFIMLRFSIVSAIIFNLSLATLIMFTFSFTSTIWLVFVISFLLGMCNSSTRILRITYLFNHIPNNIIGRANSVFMVVNTTFRMIFVSLFSLAFFTSSNHVVYAYFIFGVFALSSLILLILIAPRLPKT